MRFLNEGHESPTDDDFPGIGSGLYSGGGGSPEIPDGSITTAKLAPLAVTTDKIADGAVTTDKLATSSVATEKLQDLCVTTPKIADQAVDTTKLNTGGSPGGSVE